MSKRILKRAAASLLVIASTQWALRAAEWPQWRGPARDGVASSFRAPKEWPEKLRLRWRVPVGFGAASPVMSGNRVYLFTNEGKGEVVRAVRLSDGRQLWQDSYPMTYTPLEIERHLSKGPKATPALAGGRLYTLGVSGILSAYDAATGRLRWRKDPKGGEKVAYPVYGMAISPLVVGGVVVAPQGGNSQSKMTGYDAATGEVRWQWGADNIHPELGLGYSSPILAEIAGARQVVFWTGREVVGVAPETGRTLWRHPFKSQWDNASTPVYHNGLVLVSGNPMGMTAIRVSREGDAWTAAQVWQQPQVFNYMNTPVAAGNLLFGHTPKNKGQYYCLDLSDGKTLWLSEGREGEFATFMSAGGHVLILTPDAKLIVARGTGQSYETLRRYQVADSQTWAHPVLFDDKILVKDESNLSLWSVS